MFCIQAFRSFFFSFFAAAAAAASLSVFLSRFAFWPNESLNLRFKSHIFFIFLVEHFVCFSEFLPFTIGLCIIFDFFSFSLYRWIFPIEHIWPALRVSLSAISVFLQRSVFFTHLLFLLIFLVLITFTFLQWRKIKVFAISKFISFEDGTTTTHSRSCIIENEIWFFKGIKSVMLLFMSYSDCASKKSHVYRNADSAAVAP